MPPCGGYPKIYWNRGVKEGFFPDGLETIYVFPMARTGEDGSLETCY